MTNQEAVDRLQGIKEINEVDPAMIDNEDIEALNKAIEVLKKDTCYKITCCSDCEIYDREKHNCPRFCEVIKNTIKEIKLGGNTNV